MTEQHIRPCSSMAGMSHRLNCTAVAGAWPDTPPEVIHVIQGHCMQQQMHPGTEARHAVTDKQLHVELTCLTRHTTTTYALSCHLF
jgi:hypothetical protein